MLPAVWADCDISRVSCLAAKISPRTVPPFRKKIIPKPVSHRTLVQQMNAIQTIPQTNMDLRREETLAFLARPEVLRELNKLEESHTMIDINPMYHFSRQSSILKRDICSVSVSFLLGEVRDFENRKSYFFDNQDIRNGQYISFDDFLNLRLSSESNDSKKIRLKTLLKKKGFFEGIKDGLPIEEWGSFRINTRTGNLRAKRMRTEAVYVVAEIVFDANGDVVSSGVGEGEFMSGLFDDPAEKDVFSIHWHPLLNKNEAPSDHLWPSGTDVETFLNSGLFHVIASGNGRARVWIAHDKEFGKNLIEHRLWTSLRELNLPPEMTGRIFNYVDISFDEHAVYILEPDIGVATEPVLCSA